MKKKRVLLVEDELTLSLSMQESLAGLDSELDVEIAASGEQALARLGRSPWDLVITDLRMPGMSGLELAERVRQVSPDTLLILMTAYGSEQVEQAAEALHVYRYLTKPFLLMDLNRVVSEALAIEHAAKYPALRAPQTQLHPFAELPQVLERVRGETEAQLVFAADESGNLLYVAGGDASVNNATLAALAAGNLLAIHELDALVGFSAEPGTPHLLITENKSGCILLGGKPRGLIFGIVLSIRSMLGIARLELRHLVEMEWEMDLALTTPDEQMARELLAHLDLDF